jgi:hypothetical protein
VKLPSLQQQPAQPQQQPVPQPPQPQQSPSPPPPQLLPLPQDAFRAMSHRDQSYSPAAPEELQGRLFRLLKDQRDQRQQQGCSSEAAMDVGFNGAAALSPPRFRLADEQAQTLRHANGEIVGAGGGVAGVTGSVWSSKGLHAQQDSSSLCEKVVPMVALPQPVQQAVDGTFQWEAQCQGEQKEPREQQQQQEEQQLQPPEEEQFGSGSFLSLEELLKLDLDQDDDWFRDPISLPIAGDAIFGHGGFPNDSSGFGLGDQSGFACHDIFNPDPFREMLVDDDSANTWL